MAKITKDMLMSEVLQKYPEAAGVMLEFGLHCAGCPMRSQETIEQGAMAHGMDEKKLEELLKKMNAAI